MQLRQTESPTLLCLIKIRASSFSGAMGKSERGGSINTWNWFEKDFLLCVNTMFEFELKKKQRLVLLPPWQFMQQCLFPGRSCQKETMRVNTGRAKIDIWRMEHKSNSHPRKAHYLMPQGGRLKHVCSAFHDKHLHGSSKEQQFMTITQTWICNSRWTS